MDTFGYCYRDHIRAQVRADLADHFKCGACGGPLDPDSAHLECKDCGALRDQPVASLKNLDFCRSLHAEEAAILQVSRAGGVGLQGCALYTTTFPCNLCASKIVHVKLARVYFIDPYPMKEAQEILHEHGVHVEHFEGFTLSGMARVWGTLSTIG